MHERVEIYGTRNERLAVNVRQTQKRFDQLIHLKCTISGQGQEALSIRGQFVGMIRRRIFVLRAKHSCFRNKQVYHNLECVAI